MKKCYFLFSLLLFLPSIFAPAYAYEKLTEADASPEEIFLEAAADTTFDARRIDFAQEWKSIQLTQESDSHTINLRNINADWVDLVELNLAAENTWKDFLRCSQQNEAEARKLYLQPEKCGHAARALANLRSQIQSYLSTGALMPLRYAEIFSCKEGMRCMSTTDFENERQGRYSGCDPSYTDSECRLENHAFPRGYYKQWRSLLAAPKLPTFHPLLVQIFLEQASLSYPFQFGSYSCPRASFCTIFGERYKVIHRYDFLNFINLITKTNDKDYAKQRVMQKEVFSELIKTGTLSNENKKYLTDPTLQGIRRTFAALKTLKILTLGHRQCGEFGLFPLATANLFIAMLSNDSFNTYFDITLDAFPMQLYKKMQDSCASVPPMVDWLRISYVLREYNPQAVLGWDLLSAAGAWRALGER